MPIMIITYHGVQMIKISSGDLSIAANPISKDFKKIKPVRFGADIVLVSRNLPEFNGVTEVTRKDKEPFIIDGPGEYEIKNVFVHGTESKSEYKKQGLNTIYSLTIDNVNMVFFGALSDPKVKLDFIEDMESVDIVFVPIGDEGVLNYAEAYKLAVSLEPKIIIPVHFEALGKKDSLKNFLKEASSDASPIEKFVFKKKDLEDKNAELIILKS